MVEKDTEKFERLKLFRDKVQDGRLVKKFGSTSDLRGLVATAITHSVADSPRPGWRRADAPADPKLEAEVNKHLSVALVQARQIRQLRKTISEYTEINKSVVQCWFESDEGLFPLRVGGADIVRHFVILLYDGLSHEHFSTECADFLGAHMTGMSNCKYAHKTERIIKTFLKAFELIDDDGSRLHLPADKAHMLRAAFSLEPIQNYKKDEFDDEIPF